jgi:histidine triad (HIT) family protein
MEDSIFTKIIKREIPSSIEYEDDEIIAINDIHPKAPVHILIIPKKQIPTINDLEDNDANLMGKIILIGKKLAKAKGLSDNGYRLIFNCNRDGGQEVFHIHCHLVGGRKLRWDM